MSSMSADASSLKRLASDLRKSNKTVVLAARRAVRAEGREVAKIAQQESGRWSNRIPTTVRVTNHGLIGVIIRAGGEPAPHAAPYENDGKTGTFRHPLNYPNQGSREHWVSQQSRPFLHPALLQRLDRIRKALVEAAVGAIRAEIGEPQSTQPGEG